MVSSIFVSTYFRGFKENQGFKDKFIRGHRTLSKIAIRRTFLKFHVSDQLNNKIHKNIDELLTLHVRHTIKVLGVIKYRYLHLVTN